MKATQFENSLILELDNKLIPGVNTFTNSTRSKTFFIVLNSYGKRKPLETKFSNSSNNTKPLKNIILLVMSFKKWTAILVAALKNRKSLSIILVIPPIPISIPDNYEHCIDKIKTELKNKMGEMHGIIEMIL